MSTLRRGRFRFVMLWWAGPETADCGDVLLEETGKYLRRLRRNHLLVMQ